MNTYTYLVSATFDGVVNISSLASEIAASPIVTALDHISVIGQNIDINFKAALSAGDKSTLDALVAAHKGNVVVQELQDELGREYVRTDSRDPHDTTYFTSSGDSWVSVTGIAVATADGSATSFILPHHKVRNVVIYHDSVDVTSQYNVSSDVIVDGIITTFGDGTISIDTPPAAGTVITADYEYAVIGGGAPLTWDPSSFIDSAITLNISFCDPFHIKDGVIKYAGGALDSKVDMYVVCPAGQYYYDHNMNIRYAVSDVNLAHYVIGSICNGTADVGVYFNTESRSSWIPSVYIVRAVVNKGSATAFSGSITLELNRQRTVIL